MIRKIVGLLAATAALVACAAPAEGAVLHRSGDELFLDISTAADNVVELSACTLGAFCGVPTYRFRLDEATNTATAGGCSPSNVNVAADTTVSCTGVGRWRLELGAGNDTVHVDACSTPPLCLLLGRTDLPVTALGEAGNDTLEGGLAGDSLGGGPGNDTLRGGRGADALDGGGDEDTVTYDDGRSAGVSAALSAGAAADAGGPDDGAAGARDDLTAIENLTGSAVPDTLLGDNGPNDLHGGGGNDVLDGRLGQDVLDGGGGLDIADFSSRLAGVTVTLNNGCDDGVPGENDCASAEAAFGGPAVDALTGDAGANSFRGGAGADVIDGGGGVDAVSYEDHVGGVGAALGDPGANSGDASDGAVGARDRLVGLEALVGGPGGDLLVGDAAANTINGVGGDDVVRGLSGADTLIGGAGRDAVDYSDRASGQPVAVSLDNAAPDGAGGEGDDVGTEFERVVGGAGADTLTCAVACELVGGLGNDELNGSNDADTLVGGLGDDKLDGSAGADSLAGSEGNDDVEARDGVADAVDCGPDFDKALTDGADTRANCEEGGVDGDRDGFTAAQDCDDGNADVRPGGREIAGNGVDENCDGVKAPYPLLASTYRLKWEVYATGTELTAVSIGRLPGTARVRVTCAKTKGKGRGRGCPLSAKTFKPRRRVVALTKTFAGRRLRPGTLVTLRVSAGGYVGKVHTIEIRRRKDPRRGTRCLPPGAKKTRRC